MSADGRGWAVIDVSSGAADLLSARWLRDRLVAAHDAAGRRWPLHAPDPGLGLRGVPGGWADRGGEVIVVSPSRPRGLDHGGTAPAPPRHRGTLLLQGVDRLDAAALLAAAPEAVWQAWLSAGTAVPGRWTAWAPQVGLVAGRHRGGAVDVQELAARIGPGPAAAVAHYLARPDAAADLPRLGGAHRGGGLAPPDWSWRWSPASRNALARARDEGLHTGDLWRVVLTAPGGRPVPSLVAVRAADLPRAALAATTAHPDGTALGALHGDGRDWRPLPAPAALADLASDLPGPARLAAALLAARLVLDPAADPDAAARRIAGRWHDGPGSALWRLADTGATDRPGLAEEVAAARAFARIPDRSGEDPALRGRDLDALDAYVAACPHRGPVAGWGRGDLPLPPAARPVGQPDPAPPVHGYVRVAAGLRQLLELADVAAVVDAVWDDAGRPLIACFDPHRDHAAARAAPDAGGLQLCGGHEYLVVSGMAEQAPGAVWQAAMGEPGDPGVWMGHHPLTGLVSSVHDEGAVLLPLDAPPALADRVRTVLAAFDGPPPGDPQQADPLLHDDGPTGPDEGGTHGR